MQQYPNQTVHKTSEVVSELVPGQSFEIETVAVGQTFGVVPSIPSVILEVLS